MHNLAQVYQFVKKYKYSTETAKMSQFELHIVINVEKKKECSF